MKVKRKEEDPGEGTSTMVRIDENPSTIQCNESKIFSGSSDHSVENTFEVVDEKLIPIENDIEVTTEEVIEVPVDVSQNESGNISNDIPSDTLAIFENQNQNVPDENDSIQFNVGVNDFTAEELAYIYSTLDWLETTSTSTNNFLK